MTEPSWMRGVRDQAQNIPPPPPPDPWRDLKAELELCDDDAVALIAPKEPDDWWTVTLRSATLRLEGVSFAPGASLALSLTRQFARPIIEPNFRGSYAGMFRGRWFAISEIDGNAHHDVNDRIQEFRDAVMEDPQFADLHNLDQLEALIMSLPREDEDDAFIGRILTDTRVRPVAEAYRDRLDEQFGDCKESFQPLEELAVETDGEGWEISAKFNDEDPVAVADGTSLVAYAELAARAYLSAQVLLHHRELGWLISGPTGHVCARLDPSPEDSPEVRDWLRLRTIAEGVEGGGSPLAVLLDAALEDVKGAVARLVQESATERDPIAFVIREVQDQARQDEDAPRRRQPIPERVRNEVWRRDEGRCQECGSQERLEFDHIVPWSRGGADTARNLQLLCEPCNRRKGSRI